MSAFWKMGMQSKASMDEEMRARVIETSINGQRLVDQWSASEMTPTSSIATQNSVFPIVSVGAAHLKTVPAGERSSLAAYKYYAGKAKMRRDALLAKYQTEQTEATE